MSDESVIAKEASDLEYVSEGHLFRTPALKTNTELVILLAELESANAERKRGTTNDDINYAEASALRHLVEIAKTSIPQELEQVPLHTWESGYSGTPREKIEDIFLYLSEPDRRYQALTELRSLDTDEEAKRWENITNTIAILMLASSKADEKRLGDMLDKIITGLSQKEDTNPRQPFLQTMLITYLHEADPTIPTSGQLIAWCVKNGHGDMILDSIGESNNSISQMLLNVQECIADYARQREAVSASKGYGGGYMDVEEDPHIKDTTQTSSTSPDIRVRPAMPPEKSVLPETFIG